MSSSAPRDLFGTTSVPSIIDHVRFIKLFVIPLTFTAEVEVRLHGLNTSHAGHVQVKYNGTWGTICAVRDLTYRSAEVICRQLGQGPPVKHKFSNNECTATNHGADTVWLSDLNCQGYEDTIDQCPHRGWGILDPEFCRGCTPKYCSVCLICQPRDANVKGTVKLLLSFLKKHLSPHENFWNFYILILVISYPSRLKISCFKETKLSGGRLTLVAKRIHIKSLQHSSAKHKKVSKLTFSFDFIWWLICTC